MAQSQSNKQCDEAPSLRAQFGMAALTGILASPYAWSEQISIHARASGFPSVEAYIAAAVCRVADAVMEACKHPLPPSMCPGIEPDSDTATRWRASAVERRSMWPGIEQLPVIEPWPGGLRHSNREEARNPKPSGDKAGPE